MSLIPTTLERLERGSAQLLDKLAARPRLAAATFHAVAEASASASANANS